MSSPDNVTPHSLQELWDWTAERLGAQEASHLDAILMQIGDRTAANPPAGLSAEDRLVLDLWHSATPDERHRLVQLFMRTVGHQEFLNH